jgi:hypothetical protein
MFDTTCVLSDELVDKAGNVIPIVRKLAYERFIGNSSSVQIDDPSLASIHSGNAYMEQCTCTLSNM